MNWNNNIPSRQNVEISSEKENLDASRLVTFHFSEKIPLDIMGDAQNSVAYYVDGYFSMLDAPKWTDPFLMSISDHSPEFQKRRDEVMYRLMEIPGFTNEKMKSAHIWRGWILEIQTNDGERYKFNLISAWNNAHKTLDEQKQIIERQNQEFAIQNKTQEEERKLQDIVAKQAFYGGSVVLEYALGTAATVAGGIVITKAGSLAAKGTTYVARSMFITEEDGSKKRIHFKKWFVGMAEDFKDSIGPILRKSGYDYDPVTKKPYSVTKRLITAAGKDLQNLKYADYKKTPEWAKMSEQEFENFKQKAIADQQKMLADYNAGKISPKNAHLGIKRIIGEAAIFFPFVASEYHNNQSAYSVLNAFATEWMFAVGAKIGSKIPAPGPWKLATVLGGGLVFAIGGNTALEKMDARRHVWLNIQKMNYRDERSALLHATSFGLTEALGGVNAIWRKITGNNNFAFDIGIERTNVTIPFFNKNIGTIPELNLYQNKVTMGTKPWEWLNASAFRNIEDWNKAVDRYKIEATEEIYEILGAYHWDKGIFADNSKIKELGSKENLLKKELLELLLWENQSSDIFRAPLENMVKVILAEATKDRPMSIPNSYINEMIATNIGAMKIDSTLFVEDRRLRTLTTESKLLATIDVIPNLTIEQKNFLQKIPERMLANQDLYQNDSEKLIYEYLLKREDKIAPEGVPAISVGNYIADWLDQVVEWKHETKFLNDIKAWKSWKSEWTSF